MKQFKENYQNQNERMNPQLENMLKSMQSDLANNPAFPKTDANGNPINFIELIGYKRFLDVIEKVKRYTNLQNVTGGGLGQLSSMLMQGVQFIQQVEAPHKRELENLAVDLVVEEMEIPDGAFQFQCKLVPVGSINQDGFQIDGKEPSEEEINQAFQDISQDVEIPADELFEDEKHKRRFINMLIQGSSKKGHYMFELVRRKVNEYNPNLAETYGKVMSINDLLYWILDDETVRRMAESDSSMGGKEGIEEGEDGDTIIKTEAICFPISLHEIIKGIMEVLGTQGLPDDPQQANLVIDAVDSLSNETMDLRLGVPCWEKIYSAYPDFILEEGNRYLQNYLFARYCALPTDEFFRVSRLILSDDPRGAKYFAKMVDEIQNDLQREDYEQNIDDINLDDLLGYKNGGGVGKYYGGNYLTNKDLKELENWNFIEKDRIRIIPEINEYGTRFGYNVEYLDENGQWEGSYSVSAYSKREAFEKLKDKFQGKEYSNGGGVRKYTGGGMIDLFEDYENIPPKIQKILDFYEDDFQDGRYDGLSKALKEVEANGYTFEYYLDGVAYGLRPKNVPLNKLKGYEDEGGMIDLFEDYENIPANVKSILDEYELEESDYDTLLELQNRLEDIGYTFEFGLDAEPFALRPSNVKITELQGYEDFDDSDKFNVGGEAEFDVYNWDDKMALINIGQIYEYAIELDEIIDEDTQLEEWVKMKLTRIEQNIADVKHSLEGWEKYSSGGQIAKKQLLHIAKYSKDLIEMISNGSKLMSWQEGKLSVSAQSIDDIYHHLDYKMGNRAVDLENESEDKYGRGRQVVKKTSNENKQVKKYVVKGYVYDGGEIWKESFDNIDEAYQLAYQIQNGWTDDGTYYLITIYDEKGKKVATISDDKYFNELTELKLFKKVNLGADTKKERQVENEKLKGYKFNLQVRIADGGATVIFEKTFDSIFDVMDKMNTYYEEDYYALINDESLDYWEDKYYEIDSIRNYIKGKYGWYFLKENNYWIAKDDYDNNHIVRIVNGKPTSDSSITKGALKQIMELEAQKKYSEKPKHNKSLSDMKKIWDGLSDNYEERENIVFLIGYDGGQLREVVPYKFNDFNKSFQIEIMNAYFGQTEEQKQKIINKKRKEHEELVKNYPTLRNLYGKKFVDGGDVQGWMKEALLNLKLVEDDNSLQITHTNDDSFYVEGDSAEYRVFKTYDNAYDFAIEQVREDLEENPDFFNQEWLLNWVDMDDTIENILEEYYRSYADDIAYEDDSRYKNRLIAEMVANGLMTEEEATSEEADDIAEDNIDNFVDLYVEENIEGDKGINWYISNFGQDDFRDLVIDNNLIDISGASEDAIDTDGVAHFLSSYDGEEIELDNDVVAYRTN